MPQPEGAQLTQSISPMLTNIAVGFIPSQTQFVARNIFPTVPVAAPAGQFPIWNNGDFLRRGGKRLANYEAPPIEGFATSRGNYSTDHWGVSTVYTAKDLAMGRVGGTSDATLRALKTKFVTLKGLLEREIQVATIVQTAANWTTTNAGVAAAPGAGQFLRWNVAGSDPVADVKAAKTVMRLLTGFEPNKMVLPVQVKDALLNNTSLIDRIKYSGTPERPTQVTLEQLKVLFEIDNIEIPAAVYNSAAEGAADSLGYVWSNTVWMGYVTPAPSIDQPSAGYNFAWSGDTSSGLPVGMEAGDGPNPWGSVMSPEGLFIRTYLQERPQGRFIDCEKFDNAAVVAAGLGYTFTTPLS